MRRVFLRKMHIRAVFVFWVFVIMLLSILAMGIGAYAAMRLGLYSYQEPNHFFPFILLFLFSLLLGTALAAVVSKRTLKPLEKIIEANRKVAAGDFSIRLDTTGVPEIEDLTASFNAMAKELGSIETMRSDFISNFSHEFRTPIASIRGFAKLLKDSGLTDEEKGEYIDIIIHESERLAGLAASVLDISKLENLGILSERSHFCLDEQIRRAAALMEPRWRQKGISVSFDLCKVEAYGDENLLKQVWVNLLDNAIKFTGPNGAIALSLAEEMGQAVFAIADNGIGMSDITVPHIFDKFYQGDTSHSGSGNGLGLSIAKRIVMIHGGTIAVESSLGDGSVFTVALPVIS